MTAEGKLIFVHAAYRHKFDDLALHQLHHTMHNLLKVICIAL